MVTPWEGHFAGRCERLADAGVCRFFSVEVNRKNPRRLNNYLTYYTSFVKKKIPRPQLLRAGSNSKRLISSPTDFQLGQNSMN